MRVHTLTVTKTGTTVLQSTVGYGFSDGTATAADYSGSLGTLTFAAGETSKTITVSITNDSPGVYEGPETFNVNLTGATNAKIGDALGVGTIVDDGTTGGPTSKYSQIDDQMASRSVTDHSQSAS